MWLAVSRFNGASVERPRRPYLHMTRWILAVWPSIRRKVAAPSERSSIRGTILTMAPLVLGAIALGVIPTADPRHVMYTAGGGSMGIGWFVWKWMMPAMEPEERNRPGGSTLEGVEPSIPKTFEERKAFVKKYRYLIKDLEDAQHRSLLRRLFLKDMPVEVLVTKRRMPRLSDVESVIGDALVRLGERVRAGGVISRRTFVRQYRSRLALLLDDYRGVLFERYILDRSLDAIARQRGTSILVISQLEEHAYGQFQRFVESNIGQKHFGKRANPHSRALGQAA
jgi:hypothetical protein